MLGQRKRRIRVYTCGHLAGRGSLPRHCPALWPEKEHMGWYAQAKLPKANGQCLHHERNYLRIQSLLEPLLGKIRYNGPESGVEDDRSTWRVLETAYLLWYGSFVCVGQRDSHLCWSHDLTWILQRPFHFQHWNRRSSRTAVKWAYQILPSREPMCFSQRKRQTSCCLGQQRKGRHISSIDQNLFEWAKGCSHRGAD